jgi:hypothetical protein
MEGHGELAALKGRSVTMEKPRITIEMYDGCEENARVCHRYWATDEAGKWAVTVREMMVEGVVPPTVPKRELANFIRGNCIAMDEGVRCNVCDIPRPILSRSDWLTARRNASNWICHECRRAEAEERKQAARTDMDAKRDAFASYMRNAAGKERPLLKDLSPADAVKLLALLRVTATETLEQTRPIAETHRQGSERIAPERVWEKQCVIRLYRNGIIEFAADTDVERICPAEDGGFRFYYDEIKWHPSVMLNQEGVASLSKVMSTLEGQVARGINKSCEDNHMQELMDLCRDLALSECLEYLHFVLEEHGLPCKPGEKTRLILSRCLEKLSVAQVYSFIWRAGKDAAAFQMRKRVPKTHAANIAPGAIERSFERAMANGWEVRCYRRDFRIPQTVLSRLMYNVMLGVEDGGFNEPYYAVLERRYWDS